MADRGPDVLRVAIHPERLGDLGDLDAVPNDGKDYRVTLGDLAKLPDHSTISLCLTAEDAGARCRTSTERV